MRLSDIRNLKDAVEYRRLEVQELRELLKEKDSLILSLKLNIKEKQAFIDAALEKGIRKRRGNVRRNKNNRK